MKGWQIVIFGFLGCIGAGIFLIPLYYIILPFEWGAWIDGFPFSLIVSAPGTIDDQFFHFVRIFCILIRPRRHFDNCLNTSTIRNFSLY